MYRSFYREPADVGELIEVFGLGGKRDDYYRSLSGGQRQRLSVALALIGRPKIAVLDEMTTASAQPRTRINTGVSGYALSSNGTGPCTWAPCWGVQSMKPCSNSLRRPLGTDELCSSLVG